MKRLFFSVLCTAFLLLSSLALAQTNAWVTWNDDNIRNSQGEVVAKHIRATFTMDSVTTAPVLLSKVIEVGEFLGSYPTTSSTGSTNYPVYFRWKNVNAYGDTANFSIRLMACYQSTTDTVAADTLCDMSKGSGTTLATTSTRILTTDSTGVLTFSSGRLTNQYRIAVQNVRRDIRAGTLDLLFIKPGKDN
jgi:hypothetical protein